VGQFEITGPTGKKFLPPPGRYWRCNEAQFNAWLSDGRITFGKSRDGRPMLKKYRDELLQGLTPTTWWKHEDFATAKDASIELKNIFGGEATFGTPKPTRLLERILQIATSPGDLVLDSFGGSGTTAHAALKLNQAAPGKAPRRFILVEMDVKIARQVTAERVRRVAGGYTNPKGGGVDGMGGSFRFCELGEPLFDETGKIRDTVSFSDLARHVYFSEMGEPLPRERVTKSPFIGECRGVGIYLLYNGILGDKTANGGNVLTRAVLAQLPLFNGPKVIYCAGCLLGRERLQVERITVRQTPYEIKVA
jgi:site-specific DNA-methyltransferase (adenine-specific)/adenine-specific DNA-methyltransferase